jgi:hypothetical protein
MDAQRSEQAENAVFTDDVSDEALEVAARSGYDLTGGTSANCTATVIWSTFCPNG